MSEGLYIRNLSGDEAKILLELTEGKGGETSLEQSSACIGVPTCQIGIAESQLLLRGIIEYFNEREFNKDILPALHISGCNNSCGTHQIGALGFAGKKKKINDVSEECFQLHMDGRKGIDGVELGKVVGDIRRQDIPKFLYELAIDVDKLGITYEEYVKNSDNNLEAIINTYMV